MSYDPSQDRLPSPIEVGELFVATRELAVVHGNWTLGDPRDPVPDNWDRPTFRQERFFGLSGFVIGDIFEVGAYPVASYPPTHCFELSDLGALLALVPDAEDILGIGEGGVQVVYHEPYVRTYGDEPPQDLLERRPQVSDCAFILGATALPGILRRTYRLIPGERSNYARGTRTDLYNESGVLRDDSGRFPDIRYTEWDCLTRFVQCAVSLAVAAAESGRTPQEE